MSPSFRNTSVVIVYRLLKYRNFRWVINIPIVFYRFLNINLVSLEGFFKPLMVVTSGRFF